MIELAFVSKTYQRKRSAPPIQALKNLNLKIRNHETVCLIGPSGCGKTTSLKLINRLIEPTSGEVWVDDQEVSKLDLSELRRKVGYVTQHGGLFPHLTVVQNIGLLGEVEGWKRAAWEARIQELLKLVGLPSAEYARKYPCELSGGQRQRVCVARALFLDPPYILMDEPFSALDPITRHQIQEEFITLESILRKTVVIVTHDIQEAFKLGDRVALLNQGELVQFGREEDFKNSPANDFVADFVQGQLESVK